MVYCIICPTCGKQYVGSTIRALRYRINNHRSALAHTTSENKRDDDCFALYKHLSEHTDGHFEIIVLEHVTAEAKTRIQRAKKLKSLDIKTAVRMIESDWITDLMTVQPFGLNMNDGTGSQTRKKRTFNHTPVS